MQEANLDLNFPPFLDSWCCRGFLFSIDNVPTIKTKMLLVPRLHNKSKFYIFMTNLPNQEIQSSFLMKLQLWAFLTKIKDENCVFSSFTLTAKTSNQRFFLENLGQIENATFSRALIWCIYQLCSCNGSDLMDWLIKSLPRLGFENISAKGVFFLLISEIFDMYWQNKGYFWCLISLMS